MGEVKKRLTANMQAWARVNNGRLRLAAPAATPVPVPRKEPQ
jgi:hypothetical protein